jgi:quercetin dioxygenase-like cupin family protein
MLVVSAVVLYELLFVGRIQATPALGFEATTIAVGRFENIDVRNRDYPWLSFQKTTGPSDLYVQSNVWAPGGTTGWHTHPGHSLITVTAGTVTAYDGHDPSCKPHVYSAGMGFVDPGGDHVHVLRNEGSVEARTIAVQLIPVGADRRIDGEAPFSCPF